MKNVVHAVVLPGLFVAAMALFGVANWDAVKEFARSIPWPNSAREYVSKVSSDLAAEDVLSASKQTENEKGQVIEHSYGGSEHAYEQTYVARQYLTLVAKTDNVTIKGIVGNRGNCQLATVFGSKELPVELKFGESIKLFIDCDSLIEAEADTNLGPIKFEWDN